MIKIDHLSKSFGDLKVLDDISLIQEKNEIIALLGPNGSGKTTLLKSYLGLVIPDSGEMYFRRKSIKNDFTYRAEISYLPQIAHFPSNLTVKELITLMKDLRSGDTRENRFIEMFRLDKELYKKMGNLSGGTKQKVNILLALMHDTPLIIMDEPTIGLDPLSLYGLMNFIKEERSENKLIIITTHILQLAEELAESVLFLIEGKVRYKGSLSALKSSQGADNLSEALVNLLKTPKTVLS